ncbi:hypothetical protein CDV31_005269 [Fusarium ambrosium]|uniref:Uncharacterized protein n=1 Tax=Fusarium ambrosium TaxID=131363 RepID=A0A428UKK3_9HYPO|nr:hypothetical protein CDV31_005269 [Fusarium ambrosium]
MAEQGSGRPQDSSDKRDAPSDKTSTGAKAPTQARPYGLGVEEARALVDRLAGPGSRNGPPGRNDSVTQHGDHISFSGSGHAAHTAIDMMAQAIGDDENKIPRRQWLRHLPIDPATMDWAAAQRTYPAAEAPSSQIQDKAARVTKNGKSGGHAGKLPTDNNESMEEDDMWLR